MSPGLPVPPALRRRRIRQALPAVLRERIGLLTQRNRPDWRQILREPLALARLVALDLETTGPRMDRASCISIGAIAIRSQRVRHDESFERVLRQATPSAVSNILIHQIGGQQQLGGAEPAQALLECLEFLGSSVIVAFRAEFDASVLQREAGRLLGVRIPNRFVDLAVLLPALFPDTQNDTLEDWLAHFRMTLRSRHQAIADAYIHAALLLIVLEQAGKVGLSTTGDLIEIEKAQRWLGLRR